MSYDRQVTEMSHGSCSDSFCCLGTYAKDPCFFPESEGNVDEVTSEDVSEHAFPLPLPLHQPPHWMDGLPVKHALLHRFHGTGKLVPYVHTLIGSFFHQAFGIDTAKGAFGGWQVCSVSRLLHPVNLNTLISTTMWSNITTRQEKVLSLELMSNFIKEIYGMILALRDDSEFQR